MNDESNDLINQENSSEITTEQVTENNVITEDPTVEPVTENSEPVISDSVETPIIDNAIVENSESIKKEKKPINKKLLFIIIGILLVAIIAVILIVFVFGKGGEKDSFKDPFTGFKTDGFTEVSGSASSEDFTQSKKATHMSKVAVAPLHEGLLEDYKSGKISADDYVMQSLYSIYEPSKLKSEYKSLKADEYILDEVKQFVHDNLNSLSKETMMYFGEKCYFFNFSSDKVKQTSNINDNYTVQPLFAGNVQELNNAILSSNGNFIVYYSTLGDNKTTTKYAQKVADILEETVKTYKKKYGYDYTFKLNDFYDGVIDLFTGDSTVNLVKNVAILQANKIPLSKMKTAMPVYIIAFDGSIQGKYTSDIFDFDGRILEYLVHLSCLLKTSDCPDTLYEMDSASLNSVMSLMESLYITPNFVVDNNSTDDEIKMIVMHELFHHYQHTVICGNKECPNSKEFPNEMTANLAVAQNYSTNTIYSNLLSNWASAYAWDSKKPIDRIWDYSGYAGFVFGYNYADIVDNGTQIIMNSSNYGSVLRTLEEKSKGKYKDVMVTSATKLLTLDYTNKFLIPYAYDQIQLPPESGDYTYKDKISDHKGLFKSSSRYYYITPTDTLSKNLQVTVRKDPNFNQASENSVVALFGRNSQSAAFKELYKQDLNKEFVFNPSQFTGKYSEIAYMLVNPSAVDDYSYVIEIDPNGTKELSFSIDGESGKTEEPNSKNIPGVTGISDYQLAKARTIYCKRKEDNSSTMTQTTEVLVNYKDSTKIKDMYVKETLDASSLDSSSPAYNLAKQLMDVSFKGIEQLFNMYFKQAKTIYEKKDLKYSLTVKLPEKYFDNLGDVYNFQGNRKIDIINGLTEEGFACYLK